MARLTPVNYNMQVLNPLQTAMAGYQAGFGQMQQLDEVRRQREADIRAQERHEAEIALIDQQRYEAEAKQRQGEEAQTALGSLFEKVRNGTARFSDFQNFVGQYPQFAEALKPQMENLSAAEQQEKINEMTSLVYAARENPEQARSIIVNKINAAENQPEIRQMLQGQLQAFDEFERMEPGMGASYLQTVGVLHLAGMAQTDEQRRMIDSAFGAPKSFTLPEVYRAALFDAGYNSVEDFDKNATPEEKKAILAKAGEMYRTDITTPGQSFEFTIGQGTTETPTVGGDVPLGIGPKAGVSQDSALVVDQETNELRVNPLAGSEQWRNQILGGQRFTANQMANADFFQSIIDMNNMGYLINPEADNTIERGIKSFAMPADFLARFSEPEARDAQNQFRSGVERMVQQTIQMNGIGSRNFDTPAEIERIRAQVTADSFLSALKLAHTFDLLNGAGNQLDILYEKGEITPETYINVLENGAYAAENLAAQLANSPNIQDVNSIDLTKFQQFNSDLQLKLDRSRQTAKELRDAQTQTPTQQRPVFTIDGRRAQRDAEGNIRYLD